MLYLKGTFRFPQNPVISPGEYPALGFENSKSPEGYLYLKGTFDFYLKGTLHFLSVARVPHKCCFYTLIYGQILGVLTLRRKPGISDIECIRAYIWGSEHYLKHSPLHTRRLGDAVLSLKLF